MTATTDYSISFEGLGEATELWGGTQANFLVRREGHAAREVAAIVNDAAVAVLAKELGSEDTPHFREAAARIVGRLALERNAARTGRMEALLFVSAGTLREDPFIIEEARRLSSVAEAMIKADEAHDRAEAEAHGH